MDLDIQFLKYIGINTWGGEVEKAWISILGTPRSVFISIALSAFNWNKTTSIDEPVVEI